MILYTSGTTGQPKGAELTHFNIFINAALSHEMLLPAIDPRPDARNVALITLPLFHSFGQVAQMDANLFGGMTRVLLPRFEPRAVLDTMAREHVNCWAGVPTMYWALLQYAKANQIASTSRDREHLRLACSGGAPMPVEVIEAVRGRRSACACSRATACRRRRRSRPSTTSSGRRSRARWGSR